MTPSEYRMYQHESHPVDNIVDIRSNKMGNRSQ